MIDFALPEYAAGGTSGHVTAGALVERPSSSPRGVTALTQSSQITTSCKLPRGASFSAGAVSHTKPGRLDLSPAGAHREAALNTKSTASAVDLIRVCAWCEPDRKGPNLTHGICQRHTLELLGHLGIDLERDRDGVARPVESEAAL